MRFDSRSLCLALSLGAVGCGGGGGAPTLTMVGASVPCIDPHTGATRGTFTLWCDAGYQTCEYRLDGSAVSSCTGGSSSQSCIDAAMTASNACLGVDAGAGSDGGGTTNDGGPVCRPPTASPGTHVGSAFAPLTLDDCAGVSHDFYSSDACTVRYTVITFTAGSSVGSSSLLDGIAAWRSSYPDVRFIDVFVQDAAYHAPTTSSCTAWQSAHATPSEWMNPAQHTNIYFPAGDLPAAAIVDAMGIIRYRSEGSTASAASLRAGLDGLP